MRTAGARSYRSHIRARRACPWPETEEEALAKEISFEDALRRARRMSERYVEKGPYEFFPLPEIVEEVSATQPIPGMQPESQAPTAHQ